MTPQYTAFPHPCVRVDHSTDPRRASRLCRVLAAALSNQAKDAGVGGQTAAPACQPTGTCSSSTSIAARVNCAVYSAW